MFKPMLAAKANPDKLRFPLLVQAKLDGIRCSIVAGRPLTRTLKDIPNREIREALKDTVFEGLDGELIVGDPRATDCYRRTCSFVMSEDKTGEPWHYYVFDRWDSNLACVERLRALDASVTAMNTFWSPDNRFVLVPAVYAIDAEDLASVEEGFVNQGYEGVILRDPNAYYKFGRASATKGELLKLKRFDDFEAVVIGSYEEQHNANEALTNALGRTERSTAQAGKVGKGSLGGLICRGLSEPYKGVDFRVGTGFDRDTRADLWAKRDALPGLYAKIKHFSVGAKDKPRFPTFLGFRDELDM